MVELLSVQFGTLHILVCTRGIAGFDGEALAPPVAAAEVDYNLLVEWAAYLLSGRSRFTTMATNNVNKTVR